MTRPEADATHVLDVAGDVARGFQIREPGAGAALYTAGTEAEARHVARFLTRTACLGAAPALRAWVRLHWNGGGLPEEERSLDLFGGGE